MLLFALCFGPAKAGAFALRRVASLWNVPASAPVSESFPPRVRYCDRVFQLYKAHFRVLNVGFNGNNHTGFKRSLCMLVRVRNRPGGSKPWRFMRNEPDTMRHKVHVILV